MKGKKEEEEVVLALAMTRVSSERRQVQDGQREEKEERMPGANPEMMMEISRVIYFNCFC